jgi:chromosome segregation ATPase
MGQDNGARELVGRSIEAATERVLASADRDPETVRETLAEISEGGTVTRAAIDEALADLSKVVATPETRVEVAQTALADAREAAEPVRDTDVVRSRLNGFETELSTLDERVDALGSRLSSLVERAQDPEDTHAIALAIREIRAEATDAQRDADALAVDIEAFERELRDPDRWADELREDIDAIAESVAEPLEVANDVSDADDDGLEGTDPALRWADAALQNRMQKLFIEDVRAEIDAARQAARHAGIDDPCAGLGSRLDELETRRADVGRRLKEVADPAWSRNHRETIESFARTLQSFDPPVNWTELQDELESHRERLGDAQASG